MNRNSSPKHQLDTSTVKPSSATLADLSASSVIENIKQTALPREITFSLHFSYLR